MKKPPATAYSLPLLAPLLLTLPLMVMTSSLSRADTGNTTRPLVEVNFNALKTSGSGVPVPTRIIDGETVITLMPPELRKKKTPTPPQKIVTPIATPLVKPALTLPKTDMAAAPAVPVPPINPAKLPDTKEETKFEAVATPVVKMDTAPIPTPEVVEELKAEVAESAAEKVTRTAEAAPAPTSAETEPAAQPEEDAAKEIQLAAITPDAGPPAGKVVAKAAETNDNLTRILFAKGEIDLPDAAQSDLKTIADQLLQGERQNVQLLAYGSGNNVSAARRLSLSRALAVRSELMTLGVDNKNIEVRALGEPDGGGPADRVDLLLITR